MISIAVPLRQSGADLSEVGPPRASVEAIFAASGALECALAGPTSPC